MAVDSVIMVQLDNPKSSQDFWLNNSQISHKAYPQPATMRCSLTSTRLYSCKLGSRKSS